MTRARILIAFATLLALSVVLVACGGSGGSDDPQEIVEEATLKGIESGKFDLAATMMATGAEAGKVDVDVSGAFESEEDAEFPRLDASLSTKGGLGGDDLDFEGGFTLLGNKAYVGYEGVEYEVDPTTFNFGKSLLKEQEQKGDSSEANACQEALEELEFDEFFDNLKDEGNADVGGTATSKVSGDLEVTAAMKSVDVLVKDSDCASLLGSLPSAGKLNEAQNLVEDSVKSAHFVLYVGDDHIVRRFTATIKIEPSEKAKASAKQVDLDIDATLTEVNEEQSISAPAKARPLSELFVKLGINPIELLGAFQNGGSIEGLGGIEGLGDLLEGFGEEGDSSGGGSGGGSSGGSSSPGGQEAYYECLGEAKTPVDIQNCTGLLQ